jgi:hypothetical protein
MTARLLPAWRDLTGPIDVLIGRLSLLLVIVNTNYDRPVMIAAAIGAAVIAPHPRLIRSPWPWFALAAVIGTAQARIWWRVDDHVVATTYWLIGFGAAQFAGDPILVLRRSARLLVGCIFVLAFGWKVLSSQFTSTEFFQYTMVRDSRFEVVSQTIAGMGDDELASARTDLAELSRSGDIGDRVVVAPGPRTATVAGLLTVWGIGIEGAVAASFLAPLRGRWRRLRPTTLVVFCLTTYGVVPVFGFAALLLTLGMMQENEARLRPIYPVALVLVPLSSYLLDRLGS